ncbi:MAG: DUF177 domain-containing protein [Lachnospiraceae bacterium]|nr:DUF177 domain-containing protein [Lachnospiraceae bacterium]
MLINLTDYFEVDGKRAEIKVPYEAEVFNDGINELPILEKDNLNLHIENVGGGKLVLKGDMKVVIESPCDRCLKPVKVTVPMSFDYSVVKPDGFHEEDEDDDLQDFMEGYELNSETLINNELIMSLPMKVLCKETCKGLCPVCGKNLNDGECGCDTFVPDPRMAAISDIFNAYKEV